jgi:hypothetical protein
MLFLESFLPSLDLHCRRLPSKGLGRALYVPRSRYWLPLAASEEKVFGGVLRGASEPGIKRYETATQKGAGLTILIHIC